MRDKILQAIADHKKMVVDFEADSINAVISAVDLIAGTISSGGCVLICGNGGSAADAQHIAGELVGRFLRERKALPAIALTTDSSVITSLANDYGYDCIFARQVEGLGKKGDLLWAFSTSGTSKNVIAAAKKAKEMGMKVLAFTGKTDSELEKLSDVCLCAESKFSYAVQQIHQIAYHIICDIVEENFSERI